MPRKQNRAAETAGRLGAAELSHCRFEGPQGAEAANAVSGPLNRALTGGCPGAWRDAVTPEPGVGRKQPR